MKLLSLECPLCNNKLMKKDSLHFNCDKCDIIWHIEDLDGKIDKIKKILDSPDHRIKNKKSKTYLQAEKNAVTLLYSHDWYIWGVKNTIDRKNKKGSDILIINKHNNAEFKILNWKRSYRQKGKGYHSWHYELYLNGDFLTDGEYFTDEYERSKQSDLIHHITDQILIEFFDLYTEIAECGHRSYDIRIKKGRKLCVNCYFEELDKEFKEKYQNVKS